MEMSSVETSDLRPPLGSGFSAMFRIFSRPSSVFLQIRDGLSVWPGLIVWLLVILIVTLAIHPLMQDALNSSIVDRGADPQSMSFMEPLMIAGQVIGQLIALLVIAFFYWLALTVSFGTAPFGRVFALTLYTSFVGLLYQVINAIYLILTRPEIADPSQLPGAMLDLSLGSLFTERGFLPNLLSQLGLFQIWGLVLMISGAAVLTGRTRKQAAWPILAIFLIGAVVGAGLAGLSKVGFAG